MTENFEIQPITEVTKNLENQPITTNVTISLAEALNEMSVEPITDMPKNLEMENNIEISEDSSDKIVFTESHKDNFDQESDQSENDSGLGLDPHEDNEMDEIESPESIDNEEVSAINKLLNLLGNSRYWATHINKSFKISDVVYIFFFRIKRTTCILMVVMKFQRFQRFQKFQKFQKFSMEFLSKKIIHLSMVDTISHLWTKMAKFIGQNQL